MSQTTGEGPKNWKSWISPVIELSNNWISAVGVVLVTADVCLGYVFRFRGGDPLTDVPYPAVGIGLIVLWMLLRPAWRCNLPDLYAVDERTNAPL